eukprot:Lankesteria_metandrocarpae@DN10529_c0_g1_i1.p1
MNSGAVAVLMAVATSVAAPPTSSRTHFVVGGYDNAWDKSRTGEVIKIPFGAIGVYWFRSWLGLKAAEFDKKNGSAKQESRSGAVMNWLCRPTAQNSESGKFSMDLCRIIAQNLDPTIDVFEEDRKMFCVLEVKRTFHLVQLSVVPEGKGFDMDVVLEPNGMVYKTLYLSLHPLPYEQLFHSAERDEFHFGDSLCYGPVHKPVANERWVYVSAMLLVDVHQPNFYFFKGIPLLFDSSDANTPKTFYRAFMCVETNE